MILRRKRIAIARRQRAPGAERLCLERVQPKRLPSSQNCVGSRLVRSTSTHMSARHCSRLQNWRRQLPRHRSQQTASHDRAGEKRSVCRLPPGEHVSVHSDDRSDVMRVTLGSAFARPFGRCTSRSYASRNSLRTGLDPSAAHEARHAQSSIHEREPRDNVADKALIACIASVAVLGIDNAADVAIRPPGDRLRCENCAESGS